MRESAAAQIGTGMLLGMLGLAVAWISQLPFSVAEVWWERRYGILKTSYFDALFGGWLGLGGEFLAISLTLLIVMGLAGRFPRNWWIPAAPVFVAIAALFIFTYPYLTDTHRLHDPAIAADAHRIAEQEGVGDVPVRVEDVSADTSLPNAEATGFGPSRRVILWDTLVDDFPRDEVRVVLAHEFGHLARHHLPKGLAWYALFALPGAYLIARFTRRRGGMAAPEAVPLSLLVVTVLGLLALPFDSAISRHTEAEADWAALQTTRNPAAAERLFRRFTRRALEQPDPPACTRSSPAASDRRGPHSHGARVARAQRRLARYASSAPPQGGQMRSLLQDFKVFLLRGNLIDLAVAFVIGTARSPRSSPPRRRPDHADRRRHLRQARLLRAWTSRSTAAASPTATS